MKAAKIFKPYDYNFFGIPWGASVSVRPSGSLYLYKPAGSTKRLYNGDTLVEVCTRSGFVAFGQLNRRTGKEKVIYYELLEDGYPIEVSAHHIMSEVIAMRYVVSKPSILDSYPDRRLIAELEKRGYRLDGAHRHQREVFIIKDYYD